MGPASQVGAGDSSQSRLLARRREAARALMSGHFTTRCRGADGRIKWIDEADNIVVNVGLDYVIDVAYGGAGVQTQIHPWYLGLTDGTPTVAAADTMASHAGWTTVTTYSNATDPEFVDANTGTGQRDNSGSVATFNINGTVTVGGTFMKDNNTKGSATGTLNSVVAFSGGDRSLVNLDTLEVTYTISVADDGV